MFVVTGPVGVPDWLEKFVESRSRHGADQVTPVRNWCSCHIRFRRSPVKLLVEFPRTVPSPASFANVSGWMNEAGSFGCQVPSRCWFARV